MLLLLNAFKKNGRFFFDSNKKNVIEECYYSTLGFFDMVSFKCCSKLKDALKYDRDDFTKYKLFNRYSIPAFPIKGLKNSHEEIIKTLCEGTNQDNSLYQITLLKLNPDVIRDLGKELIHKDKDNAGNNLFITVGGYVEDCIAGMPGGNIKHYIFGCLGSYDVMVVTHVPLALTEESISRSDNYWDVIQHIPFTLRRLRVIEYNNQAVFDFSSTFYIYPSTLDFKTLKTPIRCKALVFFTSIHCRYTTDEIKASITKEVKSYSPNSYSIDVYKLLGDHDYTLTFASPKHSKTLE